MAETRTFTKQEFEKYIEEAKLQGKLEAYQDVAERLRVLSAELFDNSDDAGAIPLRDLRTLIVFGPLTDARNALTEITGKVASDARKEQLLNSTEFEPEEV